MVWGWLWEWDRYGGVHHQDWMYDAALYMRLFKKVWPVVVERENTIVFIGRRGGYGSEMDTVNPFSKRRVWRNMMPFDAVRRGIA